MSERWRAVGNTMSDLTGPRFESQTFRFRNKALSLDHFDLFILEKYGDQNQKTRCTAIRIVMPQSDLEKIVVQSSN